MKMFIHCMYENNVFKKDIIIYDTTDGYRKQYICADTIWLLPLLEAAGRDDGCVHGGALVGGEVGSGRLCCPCPIIIVQRLVGDALI